MLNAHMSEALSCWFIEIAFILTHFIVKFICFDTKNTWLLTIILEKMLRLYFGTDKKYPKLQVPNRLPTPNPGTQV